MMRVLPPTAGMSSTKFFLVIIVQAIVYGVGGVVCRAFGHRGFGWQSTEVPSGVVRYRNCERCGKVENDYSGIDEATRRRLGLL